jgi:FixJ family two-component response regulator
MTVIQQPVDSAEPIVFVIDDDESVRKSVSRLLKAVGLKSETFSSAEDFLAMEPYGGIGCILLDVRMSGLSGPDLQDRLNTANYFIPIVFITGHGTIPMGVDAMKKGAVDFLPKPFDDAELLAVVGKTVEKHREIRRIEAAKAEVLERLKLLTPREDEVFRLVIAGMLNKRIGFTLGIAEKTVKVHRGKITEKLGLSSIADLVNFAKTGGIQPSPNPYPDTHRLWITPE